ncbi:MAG: dipeptide ABC transporter permease DppC, partial [Rhizobiaceae bacterium]
MSDLPMPLSGEPTLRRRLAEFWVNFSENRGAVIGFWVFLLLIAVASLAPLIAPHSYRVPYPKSDLVPPIWQEGGRRE